MQLYYAVSYFPTGGTVTILVYDLLNPSSPDISLDDDSCTEIAGTGVYLWNTGLLTQQPLTYKEYGFKMTDGATTKGDQIKMQGPFTRSILNPVLHR